MIVSRWPTLSRLCYFSGRGILQSGQNRPVVVEQVRNSGGHVQYRKLGNPNANYTLPVIVGTVFWWWVLWHVFTEGEELIPMPDPKPVQLMTDEELGVPPLD